MLPEIKCTITDNGKLLESLTHETDFQRLSESLDTFEKLLNTAITKLINDAGDLSDCSEESDDSVDDDHNVEITPTKKKKI